MSVYLAGKVIQKTTEISSFLQDVRNSNLLSQAKLRSESFEDEPCHLLRLLGSLSSALCDGVLRGTLV